VILPLYNEAAVLRRLLQAVSGALEQTECRYEIIFVNDGSTDDSPAILDAMAAQNGQVRVVHFSRNFGHPAAVQAGLDLARGDAVVVMDSDMQDDPRCLVDFVHKWREGYDVVYAVRTNRKENLLKRALFHGFYRLLNTISEIPLPNDAGNFGLLDRRVAQEISRLPERDRYFPGLRQWVGFPQVGIAVERGARHDDRPRVSLLGLVRLARTAFFSFSSAPLTLFHMVAAAAALLCIALVGWTAVGAATGQPVGTTIVVIEIAAFLTALNALGFGILGEYIGRIFGQVRGRPNYIVASARNFPRPTGVATPSDAVGAATASDGPIHSTPHASPTMPAYAVEPPIDCGLSTNRDVSPAQEFKSQLKDSPPRSEIPRDGRVDQATIQFTSSQTGFPVIVDLQWPSVLDPTGTAP
jgi:dolichol-phosphate mannosyltransferase